MKERKNRNLSAVLFFYILACASPWVALLSLKVDGALDMEWIDVGIWFAVIPWIVFACFSLVGVIFYLLVKLKRWNRRRKVDAQIIRRAKAAYVWNKPQCLGGRALELKAWKDFKIKREPGEPDAHLRRRCMAAADNELANTPR